MDDRSLIGAGADVKKTDNEGKTALFYAVKKRNNESEVRELVDGGADVNRTDNEGKTALFYAVQEPKNESVVRALVNRGADVNRIDNEGKTALFYATQRRDNEWVVRALVDGGADVNRTDHEGNTALFYAVQEPKNECVVRALVDGATDVNILCHDGKTVLFHAVTWNDVSLVRALVNRGADVNRTDNEGKTSLFNAVKEKKNESVVRSLVDGGADVNITDNEGKTALFYAVQERKNESVVRALVDGGSDVNRTDNEGKTALFFAVQENDNEWVVRALVDGDVDVNRTDSEGKTALFHAIKWNNESVVGALVDAGTHLNTRDCYGRTPLFYAITTSDLLTTYLLDRGANLYLEDNYSAFHFLFERFCEISLALHDRIQILIEKNMVSKNQILKAISSVVFIKILFFDDLVRNPLRQLLKVAKNYTTPNDTRQQKAIEEISKRISDQPIGALFEGEALRTILCKLVELGANPNSVDSNGNSALHHVIQLSAHGVPEDNVLYISNQLKEMGTSFDIKNLNEETPLVHCLVTAIKRMSSRSPCQWPEVKTKLAVCQFLIDYGSDVTEKTQSGQSVLYLILELLQQVLLHEELRNRGLDELMRVLRNILSFYKEKAVIKDNDGNTPLHLWAKLVLPPGQDYSMISEEGYTFQGLLSRILNHFKESKVCSVEDKNNNGETPLLVCSTWTAVELLLNAGANPNEMDSSGRSLLIVAAENITSNPHPNAGHFYPDVLQEPKAFWRTAVVDKRLDLWTFDKHGESVMSLLMKAESFDLAKGMIEFVFEDSNPECSKHLLSLLCAICKDKSTSVQPKTDLVQTILESGNCLMTQHEEEDSPLHFCCRNIVRNPHDIDGVHWKIAENLLLYDANYRITDSTGMSCLDIAEGCPKLKELLLKPIDINKVPLKIKGWISISTVHKEKLAYVARKRQSTHVKPYWYHKEDLAHGSFGAVFAGINEKDGREVAIKRIEKIRMKRPEDKREITSLVALADCEQVVRYLFFFEDELFSYIVLELMEGHLDQYLNPAITMDTKVSLCQDVVKGLHFLHSKKILHRDLKPTNILFKIDSENEVHLKIADFGLSRRMDSTGSSTSVYGSNVGTRCWIAPEVLNSKVADQAPHSKSSDVFACGLVFHYILSVKKHPFAAIGALQHETEANILNGNMEGWDDSLCPEAANLIKGMLEEDRKKRPSADKALYHPFFWTKKTKVDLLRAVGNQPEFECPRAKRTPPLTAVENDLEASFGTIVKYADWNDPGYTHMPAIYTEMTKKRKGYDTHSVVELVRFIRNAIAHVSESTRPTPIRKLLLEDFVFLEYFPNLVMEVYKAITTHGWNQKREEIKYAMKK